MVEPEASERLYRSVLEQMADAFYVMSAVRNERGAITDFLILDCNENAARRLKRERSDLIGQLYGTVWPRATASGMMARLAHVTTTKEVFDGEFHVDEPEQERHSFWMRATPIAGGVAITSTEISTLRHLEDAHDNFFRVAPDMLCVAGLDGYFKRLNPAWQLALGWSIEELMAKPFAEFLHPDDKDKTSNVVAKFEDGHRTMEFENRYLHKNGGYRVLSWRGIPSMSGDVLFGSARDITDLRTAEAALQDSKERLALTERLASLGTLAAGMGYEMNNPLLAVISNIGFAEEAAQTALRMLEDGKAEAPALEQGLALLRVLREALADASQGAERVRQIVQDLRRFARAETVTSDALAIPDVLATALRIAAPELENVRVIKQLGDTPRVTADEARLAQVFVNLLVNAAQALADRDEHSEIRIRTSTSSAGDAVIEISDTGIGIAPDVLSRIFDPFFTTKRIGEGMGLGLAVCHNHVAMFGGEITASSTLGQGSTFRVVLPEARAAVKTQTIPLPLVHPETRAKVLVVDDEAVVGRSLQRILSKVHDVDVAMDGQAALAMIAQARYDVILCDIMMPHISGVDLFESVASSNPEQARRFVFMTGGAFTVRTQQFLATTTNPYLLKPFSAEMIRSVAAAVIAGLPVVT
jgi:PAS domain S-box-containing protein